GGAAEAAAGAGGAPRRAGVFSAAGLLYARAERHDVRFCRVSARDGDARELSRLEVDMRAALTTGEESSWDRVADMRYRGQNWSIPVEWPEGATLAELVERFEDAHER